MLFGERDILVWFDWLVGNSNVIWFVNYKRKKGEEKSQMEKEEKQKGKEKERERKENQRVK